MNMFFSCAVLSVGSKNGNGNAMLGTRILRFRHVFHFFEHVYKDFFPWAAVHNVYIATETIGNTRLVNLHNIARQKVFVFIEITSCNQFQFHLFFTSISSVLESLTFEHRSITSYLTESADTLFIVPCTSLNFFHLYYLLYLKIKFYQENRTFIQMWKYELKNKKRKK